MKPAGIIVGISGVLLIVSACGGADPMPPGPWENPPVLVGPVGTVVTVAANDAEDLQEKVRRARSNSTIIVPSGTYRLTGPLRIGSRGNVRNVSLRGATGRYRDVVIVGAGTGGVQLGRRGDHRE